MFQIEIYLGELEFKFYNYCISNKVDPINNVNNRFLDETSRSHVIHFIKESERNLFDNLSFEQIREQVDYLEKQIELFQERKLRIGKLMETYGLDYRVNQLKFYFYSLAIKSFEQIANETHPAFTDLELFLNSHQVMNKPNIPEGAVTRQNLNSIKPLYVKQSPEAMIRGFEWLKNNGHCDLHNVKDFVHHVFSFNTNYEKHNSGFFYFLWLNKSKHRFTDLILSLKERENDYFSKQELANWITQLLPNTRLAGALKYCSRDREIVEKFRIDCQIFRG